MNYSELLLYAFRRFSVLHALKTGPETAWHYLRRKPLPPSEKPALFSMNILPPMGVVWYHLARKALGDSVDITLFDCSGHLSKHLLPEARVQKFLNFYAATKSDEFLYYIAKHRHIGWICDDDMFFIGSDTLSTLEEEFAVPNTASVSFRPRDWWHFAIDEKEYEPSASYCIAFDRSIVCDKEKLSLKPTNGNTHPSHIGKGERRYDTGDKANEVLLERGYRCAIVPEDKRKHLVTGFSGMSSTVMLLWYFQKPEQMLDYLLSPPKKQWQGNALFTILCGLLAVHTIQDLFTTITGAPYPLRSLPSREELEKIRQEHTPLLREDLSFDRLDRTSEQLLAAI